MQLASKKNIVVRAYGPAVILLVSGLLSYAEARAQTSENPYGENFRERCRKLISGAFAESYSENFRAQDGAKLAENTIKRLTPQQALFNRELATVEKKMKAGNYEPALTERRDQLIAQIKLYHDQIAVQEEIVITSKKAATSSAKKHKDLEIPVRQIFDVGFTDDPEGLPRKIFNQLTWKTPCPKFRSLCPLPPKEAQILKTLAEKIGDLEGDCVKYSSLK